MIDHQPRPFFRYHTRKEAWLLDASSPVPIFVIKRHRYANFKKHRSNVILGRIAEMDAAYCYRQSSVVCLYVCLLITFVSPEKNG